jgi:hypothetical protein
MNMSTVKLLLEPKCKIPTEHMWRKIFFLAGPIRGGGEWQMRAANTIWNKYPGSIVADPTRWDKLETTSVGQKKVEVKFHRQYAIGEKSSTHYFSQAPWEKEHMNRAAESGGLFFWFERESIKDPRPKDEGVYAQDTRVETGIWIERVKNSPELKVRFGGHWDLDEDGRETKHSFGGLNFIFFYLTGEADRSKLFRGEVTHPNLILARSVEEFIEKY